MEIGDRRDGGDHIIKERGIGMCEICSEDCPYWKKGSLWEMLENWNEPTRGPVELRRYATS